MNHIVLKLFSKNVSNRFLEPLNTIIKLAIVSFKPIGTKISINNNIITFHESSFIQGTIRTLFGDNKQDLHSLLVPIYVACNRYLFNDSITDINLLFELSLKGLENLKETYVEYQLIGDALNLYISLIKYYLGKLKDDDNDSDIQEGNNESTINDTNIKDIIRNKENLIASHESHVFKWNNFFLETLINMFHIIIKSDYHNKENYINAIENFITPIDDEIKNNIIII